MALPSSTTVVEGEPNLLYHASSGWSKSQLWDFAARGPHYFYLRHVARTTGGISTAATTHGTLLHEWFERGDSYFDELACPPESELTDTGLMGKKAQAWAAKNAVGKRLVSPKELAQLRLEAASVSAHAGARELMERVVVNEASVRWRNNDGHNLRCRPDAWTEDGIWLDLKTTKESDILGSFWRSVVDYGYHAQDALYQWGMEAVGLEPQPLVFIVVSTVAPHECQAVTIPAALTEEGRRRMRSALADISVRMDLDYWRGDQHGEVVELPVPFHAMRGSR